MSANTTMLPPLGKSGGAGEQVSGGAAAAGKAALKTEKSGLICRRQLCFLLAFLLPVPKLLEAPSLLAYFSKGDLLLPAFLHYVLQTAVLIALLCVCARSEKPLFQRLREASKPLAAAVYIALAAYFIFSDMFPLLDMARFADTVFFDTAPSVSAFLPFFLLSAFICVKDEKAIGRSADLCMPIFLFAFFGLIFMAFGETDFTELFPLFGTSPRENFKGLYHSFVHFSDMPLMIPLLGAYRYEKGDGKKIVGAYAGGGAFVLLFLAVFYGVFGALAPRETYAFDKIARYFSALDVVGRVDLLLVYLITVVLVYAYALPLQLAVICLCGACGGADLYGAGEKNEKQKRRKRLIFSLSINGAALIFVVFATRHYHFFYSLSTSKLFFVFPMFSVALPLSFLLLKGDKKK